MRKMMLIILAIIMIFAGSIGNAEEFDYSSLSDEELIAMFSDLRLELESRIGFSDDDRIGRGSYVVGKDIKAGFYSFLCLDTDYFDSGNPDNDIRIYSMSEDGTAVSNEPVFWEQRFSIGTYVVFSLTDGMLLEISGCSGCLSEINPSWAP